MTAPAGIRYPEVRRVRASERAFRIALKIVQEAGYPVDKVCITGAQIEIHCSGVEPIEPTKNDGGLEDW